MDSRKIYITKVQREDTNAMGESIRQRAKGEPHSPKFTKVQRWELIRQRGKREPYHQNSRECKRGT